MLRRKFTEGRLSTVALSNEELESTAIHMIGYFQVL
jgi:hypothetical protein